MSSSRRFNRRLLSFTLLVTLSLASVALGVEAAPDREAPEDFLYKAGVGGFTRGEGAGNLDLAAASAAPGHDQGRFVYRVRPYAAWRPTDSLEMHLEGQGYGYTGGNRHFSRYSLYQGFVEGKVPGTEVLAVKAGRQEFSYGSTFMLGPDSFYDGLSFDALRLRVKPTAPLSVDFLAGRYAKPFSGGVKGSLAGVYATYTFTEGGALEAYALHDTGGVGHQSGEHLDSWGLRATAKVGPVSLEFEPVYQSGRQADPTGIKDGISAYGGHLDATYETVIAGRTNRFSIGYALGSGSGDAANGIRSNREFRNPNNDTCLVGDMNVVGDMSGVTVNGHHASGLHAGTLGWSVDLTRKLTFTTSGHYFVAGRVEEGLRKEIGLETDFLLTYAHCDSFSLLIGYDRFFTGRFFSSASGRGDDIHYGYAALQFNLERSQPKMKRSAL